MHASDHKFLLVYNIYSFMSICSTSDCFILCYSRWNVEVYNAQAQQTPVLYVVILLTSPMNLGGRCDYSISRYHM